MPCEQGFRHLFVVYSQFVSDGLSVWWSRIFTDDISDTDTIELICSSLRESLTGQLTMKRFLHGLFERL